MVADEQYAWGCLAPLTIFKAFTVKWNETIVQHANNFNLLHYVVTRLTISSDEKQSFKDLEECKFVCIRCAYVYNVAHSDYVDDAGNEDDTTLGLNPNFNIRATHCWQQNQWEFVAELPIYCQNRTRLLLPGVRCQFSFQRASVSFQKKNAIRM